MNKSSEILRFKILLWFSGCKKFSGTSRNGPLVKHAPDLLAYRVKLVVGSLPMPEGSTDGSVTDYMYM